MEKKTYPGSRLQPLVSAGLILAGLATFATFSEGDLAVQTLLLVVFASLVFSVAIFPQYMEFTGMTGALVKEGVAKAKDVKGVRRLFPLFTLLVVLLIAPLLVLFIAPQFFLGALVGIIVGFSGFQLAFTVYIRGWEREKGLKVTRYALVSEDEKGRRTVLEYGLRAERS